MLKQKLQHKQLQKLSPQQIQLIKLLEVPTLQLEQRIIKELEENPILEESEKEFSHDEGNENPEEKDDKYTDEFTVDDYIEDDETPAYKLSVNNFSKDEKRTDIPYSEGVSLQEHLLQQLGLRKLSQEDEFLAKYLIGNIDDEGYLRREIMSIVDDLAFRENYHTTDKEIKSLLVNVIQDFDPSGVGAANLRECLMLQIKRKIRIESHNQEIYETTYHILKDFFNEFTKKHYQKIINRLNIDKDTLKEVVSIVVKLNPRPGNSFSSSITKISQHITPDFILEVNNGELILSVNSKNIPDLKISSSYSDMIETYGKSKKQTKQDKSTITYVKQKIDAARWFIDAIKQRQNTLMLTMNAILQYQEKYFRTGDETMLKPMILKDIAEKTHLDISTISRVANSKYIQTHFGIVPLKYFFSEGMQTKGGEEVSTREIKKILQECIDKENKKKPLTDERLAQILQEHGYKIARRTVAKYREQLGVLVARLRKEL